ncbi:unnamed protein product [Echinostoma caproni]|uniref:Movement protein n=1 Tax=Echinostoma caproni TaxID=27848 RepID=A0A183B864_9TREM|nr:unnamed protein product [Echinostoma caproni]
MDADQRKASPDPFPWYKIYVQDLFYTSTGSLRNLLQSAFRNPSAVTGRTVNNRQDVMQIVDSTTNIISPESNDNSQSSALCDPNVEEDLQLGHLGSSMLSLTSWDSVSTLNYPMGNKPLDRIPNRTLFNATSRKSGTGSAVWETASHLGVSTHEDMRRSFRLPVRRHLPGLSGGESGSRKLQKKPKKYKLGAMSHLFQRPSIARGSEVVGDSTGDVSLSCPPPPQPQAPSRPSTSRRESLLRGLFSR